VSNWFEDHPIRSIIVHTLIVAGAVWAAFAFIFDENKVAVYRAQVENEKATATQYKAKTEVLEVEIARLLQEKPGNVGIASVDNAVEHQLGNPESGMLEYPVAK